jgi:hypothetical protein
MERKSLFCKNSVLLTGGLISRRARQGRNRQSEKQKIERQFTEIIERNFTDVGIIDRYLRHRCGPKGKSVFLIGGSGFGALGSFHFVSACSFGNGFVLYCSFWSFIVHSFL